MADRDEKDAALSMERYGRYHVREKGSGGKAWWFESDPNKAKHL